MAYKLPDEIKPGVDGLGNMGKTIASMYLAAGYPVIGFDENEAVREASGQIVLGYLQRLARYGLLKGKAEDAIQRFTVADTVQGLESCNVLLEAVKEDANVKRKVMGDFSRLAPKAIYLTNTSSLDPKSYSQEIANLEGYAVAHHLKPADFALLVEIGCATEATSHELVDYLMQLHSAMGKHPIRVNKLPWVINPIQFSLLDRALRIYERPTVAAEVDKNVKICSEHWLRGEFSQEFPDTPTIFDDYKGFAPELWNAVMSRAKWLADQQVAEQKDIEYTIRALAQRWGVLGVLGGADAGGLPVFKDIYPTLGRNLGFEKPLPRTLDIFTRQGAYGWSTLEGFHVYKQGEPEMLLDTLLETIAPEKREAMHKAGLL